MKSTINRNSLNVAQNAALNRIEQDATKHEFRIHETNLTFCNECDRVTVSIKLARQSAHITK